MTINISPVDFVAGDTFLDFIAKANNAIDAIRFKAVTVDSNNAVGHAGITGSLSTNTIYTSEIFGGVKDATTSLTVSSNTTFVNVSFNGANTNFADIGNIRIPGANTTHRTLMANNTTSKLYFANLNAEIQSIDGEGSGIDADILDGQHGAWYADIPARQGYTSLNKAGDVVTGTFGVTGVTTLSGGLNLQSVVITANSSVIKVANTPSIDFNQLRVSSNTVTVTGTTAAIVHQFNKSDFRTAKYVISITNTTDNTIMATEILAITDVLANTAHSTQYATIYSNNSFGSFNVDNSAANTRLTFTSTATKNLVINYTVSLVK